jgi:hypothetical protein
MSTRFLVFFQLASKSVFEFNPKKSFKDTIKFEIMPNLSIAKRGYASQFDLVEIVNVILYTLKSGCQWRLLPIGHLFSGEGPSWDTVSHH